MIYAFILGALAVQAFGAAQKANDDVGRLPGDTEPLAYGLRLVPRYDQGDDRYTFTGQVEITIKVNRITPNITMHAKDMRITSAGVTEVETGIDLKVDSHVIFRDEELLVIYMGKNLLVGRQYEVRMTFHGYLRTDMTGFYKSTYVVNNETMYVQVV